jgi:hypothetical protein
VPDYTELTFKKPSELLIPKRPCVCGCGEVFQTRNKTQMFKTGHDTRLKSLLTKVFKGEAPTDQIPRIALENHERIKFLRVNADMAAAMAKGLALL